MSPRNVGFGDAAEALTLLRLARNNLFEYGRSSRSPDFAIAGGATDRATALNLRIDGLIRRLERANDPGVAKEEAALAEGLPQADARDMGDVERARMSEDPRVERFNLRYQLETGDGTATEHQSVDAAINNGLMLDEASWVVLVIAEDVETAVIVATVDAKK